MKATSMKVSEEEKVFPQIERKKREGQRRLTTQRKKTKHWRTKEEDGNFKKVDIKSKRQKERRIKTRSFFVIWKKLNDKTQSKII